MGREWRIAAGSLYVSVGIGAHSFYSHSISKNSTAWTLTVAKGAGDCHLPTWSGQRGARFYRIHSSLCHLTKNCHSFNSYCKSFTEEIHFSFSGGGGWIFVCLFILLPKRLLEEYLNLNKYSIFHLKLLSISSRISILFAFILFVLTDLLSGCWALLTDFGLVSGFLLSGTKGWSQSTKAKKGAQILLAPQGSRSLCKAPDILS